MKSLIFLVTVLFSTHSLALIDSQIAIKPDTSYMNYFFDGYLPWFKNQFNYIPATGNPSGDELLREAIYKIDHWKTSERKELDQILIGQGFQNQNTPFYTYRVYIHKDLRDHSFIRAQKLTLPTLFIERNEFNEICFLSEMKLETILWKTVIRSEDSFYMGHFCEGRLKYISQVAKNEIPFNNPFPGQSEYELRTFSESSLISVLYFVKNTHTAAIPKKHIPFINAHGEKILLPFDKYSVNKKGNLIIYYP